MKSAFTDIEVSSAMKKEIMAIKMQLDWLKFLSRFDTEWILNYDNRSIEIIKLYGYSIFLLSIGFGFVDGFFRFEQFQDFGFFGTEVTMINYIRLIFAEMAGLD